MGRLGSDYIPLINGENTKFRLVISFSRIAWFTVSLPFFGFIFCIIWSILYNFEQATETHCNVYNFLPSVSAAIGHYKPQKNVWKFTISVQAAVRALVLLMYYQHYRETTYKWARGITNLALVSYLLENIALVTLTFWSSNENYALHKISFITFLLMSLIHMFLAYIIARNCRNVIKDINEITSLKWKYNSMVLNVAAILLACYFFFRHNKHCEPFAPGEGAFRQCKTLWPNVPAPLSNTKSSTRLPLLSSACARTPAGPLKIVDSINNILHTILQ